MEENWTMHASKDLNQDLDAVGDSSTPSFLIQFFTQHWIWKAIKDFHRMRLSQAEEISESQSRARQGFMKSFESSAPHTTPVSRQIDATKDALRNEERLKKMVGVQFYIVQVLELYNSVRRN